MTTHEEILSAIGCGLATVGIICLLIAVGLIFGWTGVLATVGVLFLLAGLKLIWSA